MRTSDRSETRPDTQPGICRKSLPLANYLDGRTDGRKDGRMDGPTDGRTDGRMDGWMNGWMHGRKDERTDGRTDGQTDVRTYGEVPLCSTGLRPLRGRCPKKKKKSK